MATKLYYKRAKIREMYATEENKRRYKTPIAELDLKTRAYNSLKRAGITTIERLAELSEEEMWRIPGLGRTQLEQIKESMAEMKITFRTEDIDLKKYIAVLSIGRIVAAVQTGFDLERLKEELKEMCKENRFDPQEDDARIFIEGKPYDYVYSYNPKEEEIG